MANDVQTNIRLPTELKDALSVAAKDNGRSFTAEIVKRLQDSFEWELVDPLAEPKYSQTLQENAEAIARLDAQLQEISRLIAEGPPQARKRKGSNSK